MAEGGDTWWGSWLQSAKQKSTDVFDFMKRDLNEFTQTFQEETKNVVSTAAGALRDKLQIEDSESTANKMKRSVSTLLGTVSQAFTLAREENEDELCVIRNNEPVILDRLQSQVYAMQVDTKTYLNDPEPLEDYEKWLRSFDFEQMQPRLSEVLINNPEVQSLYTKLVPAMVSHIVFWHRYFFKLRQLEESEERKQALLHRVDQDNEEIRWDGPDDFPLVDEDIPSTGEITDQLATQILNDYEEECRERKWVEERKNSVPKLPSDASRNQDASHNQDTSHNHDASRIRDAEREPSTVVGESQQSPNQSNASKSSLGEITAKDSETESAKVLDVKANRESEASSMSLKASEDSQKTLYDELGKDGSMLTTKEKGDLVVVMKNSTDRISPSSSNKESSNEEEWEKDFELEVTEDDVLAAKKLSKLVGATALVEGEEDDWENWD